METKNHTQPHPYGRANPQPAFGGLGNQKDRGGKQTKRRGRKENKAKQKQSHMCRRELHARARIAAPSGFFVCFLDKMSPEPQTPVSYEFSIRLNMPINTSELLIILFSVDEYYFRRNNCFFVRLFLGPNI